MNVLERFAGIRVFVFDVDGVLTDGTLLLTEDGHFLRSLNIKDAHALTTALSKGYGIWIITGGRSDALVQKFSAIGVQHIYTNVTNKHVLLEQIVTETNTSLADVIYMGDDIPDLAAMKRVGLPCCPADASAEIKAISKYISPLMGGKGCVRDVIEKVLKLNEHWDLPE